MRDLLSDGVCSQGHRIDGEADLFWSASHGFECHRCRLEMLTELDSLREASSARKAQGRE